MGAWGSGVFENDDAVDYLAELEESPDLMASIDRGLALSEASIDGDRGSRALVAAEVVAAARGAMLANAPDSVGEVASRLGEVSPDVVSQAVASVTRVRNASESELRELWAETGDFEQWAGCVDDLIQRLSSTPRARSDTATKSQMFLECFGRKRNVQVRRGDIFTFRPKGHPYFFGCVVVDDAVSGFHVEGKQDLLMYFYSVTSESPEEVPELRVDDLLFPPAFGGTEAWQLGYFRTVLNRELSSADVLPNHCFFGCLKSPTGLVDAHGKYVLDRSVKPLGTCGFSPYKALDRQIARALGYEAS